MNKCPFMPAWSVHQSSHSGERSGALSEIEYTPTCPEIPLLGDVQSNGPAARGGHTQDCSSSHRLGGKEMKATWGCLILTATVLFRLLLSSCGRTGLPCRGRLARSTWHALAIRYGQKVGVSLPDDDQVRACSATSFFLWHGTGSHRDGARMPGWLQWARPSCQTLADREHEWERSLRDFKPFQCGAVCGAHTDCCSGHMWTSEVATEAHTERADTERLGGGKLNETYIMIPLTSIKYKVPQKTPAFFPRTHTHKRIPQTY